MNAIYRAMEINKQSFHQQMERQMRQMEVHYQLLPLVAQVRRDHPRMSAREMYRLIAPEHLGRDAFVTLCFDNGYKLERKRAFHRTTDSRGVIRFDNFIVGREFTGINLAWVSDITYYRLGEKFYYLTFIMDLYSRRIVGYSASANLMTEYTTLPALKMAIGQRNPDKGLILHSDGGGQYYFKEFLDLTHKYEMCNSMCETVYENTHAERVNGTIKNNYLIPYGPQDFNQLKQMLKKAVDMYNLYKPHKSLSGLSPGAFEELLTKNEVVNKRKKVAKKEKSTSSLNELILTQKTVNVI